MTRRRTALVALLAVAPFVAAACGGDDPTPPDGTTTTAAPGDGGSTTTTAGGDDGGAAPAPDRPEAAPLPAAVDAAPALPCDGDQVLCVDGSNPDAGFATIADALDAAGPGAVIQIAAGEYAEPVLLDGVTDLALVGGFPAGGDFDRRDPETDVTTILGVEDASVVTVARSSGIRIEGLRLTGGGGFTDGFGVEGGGVFVDQDSSDVAILANRIDGNLVDRGDDPTENRGGGISSAGADVRIVGNVVEGNRSGRGGGIAATGASTVVDRNVVVGNTGIGDHGGGLWLAGELTVTNNRIEGNSIGGDLGYGWGGGLIVFGDGTEATLRGNVVTANQAPSYGSGVFVDDGARAALVGELYFANECSYEGGAGFFVDSGGPTATVADLDHVTIAEHDCPDASQGGNAVYVGRSDAGDPQPVVTVRNSILWGNAGTDVLVADADVTVTSTLTEEGVEGDGNVSEDPRFVDPASGDFALADGSPAAGAADDGSDLGFTGAAS